MSKASDHIMEELDIDTTVYDKEELAREIEELRPKVKSLEAEKRELEGQLKELRLKRLQKQKIVAQPVPTVIFEQIEEASSPTPFT